MEQATANLASRHEDPVVLFVISCQERKELAAALIVMPVGDVP